jgi:membrane protease YdiL (CAAX protease family)
MKPETLFLKIVVCLIGIAVLAMFIFVSPFIANELAKGLEWLLVLFVIDLYASAIPFFVALYHTLRLLSYIDKNIAFSELSVRSLKYIKYCAFTFSMLYVSALPMFYRCAKNEDAPGVMLFGLVIILASIVIAVFASILQKLLKNAIDIKSENDLTV